MTIDSRGTSRGASGRICAVSIVTRDVNQKGSGF